MPWEVAGPRLQAHDLVMAAEYTELPPKVTDEGRVKERKPQVDGAATAATVSSTARPLMAGMPKFTDGAAAAATVSSSPTDSNEIIFSIDSGDPVKEPPGGQDDRSSELPGQASEGTQKGRVEGEELDAKAKGFARIERGIDDIQRELTEHRQALAESSGPDNAEVARTEDLMEQVGQVREDIHDLKVSGSAQAATVATTSVEAAAADAEAAQADFPQSSVWKRVCDMFRSLSRRLWNLVSRLVSVTQWSVTGSVGNKVLGLADVSVTVIFGQASTEAT